jgi:hypothetical protein
MAALGRPGTLAREYTKMTRENIKTIIIASEQDKIVTNRIINLNS